MLRLNRVTNTLVSPLRIFLHLVRAPRYLVEPPAGISRSAQGSAGPGVSPASWEVTGVLYRGGVIKLPRAHFQFAAGAKILAILTVNYYI